MATEGAIDSLLKRKKTAKKELSKKLSFSYRRPLLGIFLDKELNKAQEENIKKILEATSCVNIEVIVLTDSNPEIFLWPHLICLPYSRTNRKMLMEACDMALVLPFNDIEEMLLNGIIPIANKEKNLLDYNPNFETGNSFTFKNENPWSIFAALIRAMETFKFPYDWRNIISEGVKSVNC